MHANHKVDTSSIIWHAHYQLRIKSTNNKGLREMKRMQDWKDIRARAKLLYDAHLRQRYSVNPYG